MELKDKNVAVAGLGVTGSAVVDFLIGKGACVRITESGREPETVDKAGRLKEAGVRCQVGGHTTEFLEGTELVVVSPGVDDGALPLVWARERGVPVISEIELAYRFCKAGIIAISGTNGKSTVTTLIGRMLEPAGGRTYVCGNIGTPFIKIAPETAPEDTVVLEVSSFQLEHVELFRPRIALLLNVSEDHLDRYAGIEPYLAAKLRLFANQGAEDFAVVNYDQHRLKGLDIKTAAGKLYFSKYRLPKERDGAYVENEEIVVRRGGKFIWITSKEALSLPGEHNVENALAASLAAYMAGADPEAINASLKDFRPLPHRFELVGSVKGIKFIDDSKATNIDSVNRALQSSPGGVVLIAGGRDKGGDYRAIKKTLKNKVKSIILMGEARERMAGAFAGAAPVMFAEGIDQAVGLAYERSRRGDTVLLSPMCSSFDMFRDYKERGDLFRKAVEGLQK